MKKILTVGFILWIACAACRTAADCRNDAPPNILIITADNLGYGDLKSYNPKSDIKSPHLDKLAEQGARLTNFYTASPTCTVSRACLLTGRIPQRHGLLKQLAGVSGNYGIGLRPEEILIPELLQRADSPYATGCFGKWNIGFAPGSRPTERGFDEFIGHASGNLDYYNHNYREKHDLYDGVRELDRIGEYSTDIFADAAISFVERQSREEGPWFCYVPFNAPHFPVASNKKNGQPNVWQAPEWAFQEYDLSPDEKDPRKRYEAVVTALDKAIGRLLHAVDEAGVADNTFVFFMSDNGAFRLNRTGIDVGLNDPLRQGGVTCWEGGLKVVAMARWPCHIKPGSVIEEPLWSPDLLVGCTELAGVTLPDDRIYDGENLLPVLAGEAKSPHKSFFFQYGKHSAVRRGHWKIVREHPANPWQLYRLDIDPTESANVHRTHSETTKSLITVFDKWNNSF